MKIITGLGNPGSKYETSRHNSGFLAIDRLIERWNAEGPIIKGKAETYNAQFSGEKILIIKPQTFMNLSGKAIAPAYVFFKCKPDDLIVVHDDVDLLPFVMKIKTGGSPGGHNGIKSIDSSIGFDNTGYHRVKIGIGKPGTESKIALEDYVLERFSDNELSLLDKLLDSVCDAVELIVAGDAKEAMNRFNRKLTPGEENA